MKNEIIPYNPKLKELARELRKNSTLSEVLFWQKVKGKSFKYEFHRQVPLDNFIVDFYCHELMLAIEIDGSSHDEKQDYDQNRQFILENLGVKFLRFEDIDVKKKMPWVLEELQIWIENYEREHSGNDTENIPLPLSKGDLHQTKSDIKSE
jgi:very-short-patch-repair endonuclease